MFGAAGTCISLVIVGAIIGSYGDSLPDHKVAGWVGIAFIYIYDINFSYSFGKRLTIHNDTKEMKLTCTSSNRLGLAVGNLHHGYTIKGHLYHNLHDLDV